MNPGVADSSTLVFTNPKHTGWGAAGALAMGGLLLLFLAVMFMLTVNTPPTSAAAFLPAILGAVSILPLFSLWIGLQLLRTPVQVLLDSEGMTIQWVMGRRRVRWSQVAGLRRESAPGLRHAPLTPVRPGRALDVLVLLSDSGRTLARVPSAVGGFPVLAEEIEIRAWGATREPAASRGRDLRRIARRTALAGGLLAALALAAGIHALIDLRAEARLAQFGVVVSGKINRRDAKNGTPRVEFSYRDVAGRRHSAEVAVDRAAWDALEEADHVDVRYLPSEPDRCRLVRGQVIEAPPLGLLLGGSALMSMIGLAMLVIPAAGIADIRLSNGRLRLVRFSDLRQEAAGGNQVPSQPILAEPAPASPGHVLLAGGPGSETVRSLGILAVILGVWAVGLNAIRFVGAALIGSGDAGLSGLTLATWLAAGALGALLTAAGFGLAARRRWGRSLARAVAACQCALGPAMILNVVWINPVGPPGAAGPAVAGAVLGRVLGMIFPVVLLVMLRRADTHRPQ